LIFYQTITEPRENSLRVIKKAGAAPFKAAPAGGSQEPVKGNIMD
jgi:hypothetical protein